MNTTAQYNEEFIYMVADMCVELAEEWGIEPQEALPDWEMATTTDRIKAHHLPRGVYDSIKAELNLRADMARDFPEHEYN